MFGIYDVCVVATDVHQTANTHSDENATQEEEAPGGPPLLLSKWLLIGC